MRAALSLAIALGALLLAAPSLAAPIDDAKAAGHVGEQADGYLGLPPGAPASARSLVADINRQRATHYADIAKRNSTDPTAVAALAGQKLLERAAPGEWIRDAQGQWRRK